MSVIFQVFLSACVMNIACSLPQHFTGFVDVGGKEYGLRLQPELDSIDINRYLRNERLIRLQLKCLLYDDQPCDIVGRWAKPRVKAALLGECLACTEIQKGWLDTWLQVLIDKFPEFYRAAVAKYIHSNGIQLSSEEYKRINTTFSEENWKKAAEVFKTLEENEDKTSNDKRKSISKSSEGLLESTLNNNTGDLSPNLLYYIKDLRPGSDVSRIKRAERGPFPESFPSASRSRDIGNSQIPRLSPPAPGTILTYDGRSVSSNDGGISLVPRSDGRTPSIRHRPQFATYKGELPPPVPDFVPRNLPQLGPQNPNRNPKDYL